MCGSGVLALVDKKITPEVQGAKVRAQGAKIRTEGAKVRTSISNNIQGKGCSNNIQVQMQPSPPPHKFFTDPYARCSDCCIVLVLVGGGGSGSS